MKKNSRAYNILQAGLGVAPELAESAQLRAIAAMIDYATKKPTKKKQQESPLLYTATDLIQAMHYDLIDPDYARINVMLRSLPQKSTDLEQFEAWFRDVRYPFLQEKGIAVTSSMIIRKFPSWLEAAKQHCSSSNSPSVEVSSWR